MCSTWTPASLIWHRTFGQPAQVHMKILFVLNDAPYGSEKTYNALRLAMALQKVDGRTSNLARPEHDDCHAGDRHAGA